MLENFMDFIDGVGDWMESVFDPEPEEDELETGLTVQESAPYLVDLNLDGRADGVAVQRMVDLDGDGLLDTTLTETQVDIDGDGFFDGLQSEMGIDLNGDGVIDVFRSVLNVDSDGDGIYDAVSEVIDQNGDGIFESTTTTVVEDTDGDGVPDMIRVGEDYDSDGILDGFTELWDYDGDGVFESGAAAYEQFDPELSDHELVIGDPAEAMDNWHEQETGSSCAVASQEFILETLTGREFSEAELRDLAEHQGWYEPDGGTPQDDVGNILEYMGLTVNRSTGNSIEDLEQCLENGGEVIVGVDSSELWEGENDDFFGPGMGADHAVQVIGIDRTDPEQPMVILNDSGCSNGCGAMVPLDDFMMAWEDSGCFMVEAYA